MIWNARRFPLTGRGSCGPCRPIGQAPKNASSEPSTSYSAVALLGAPSNVWVPEEQAFRQQREGGRGETGTAGCAGGPRNARNTKSRPRIPKPISQAGSAASTPGKPVDIAPDPPTPTVSDTMDDPDSQHTEQGFEDPTVNTQHATQKTQVKLLIRIADTCGIRRKG